MKKEDLSRKKTFGNKLKSEYKVHFLETIQNQARQLDDKSQQVLQNKIELIKKNPFRFKKLTTTEFLIFRVRLRIQRREVRLLYAVIASNIIIMCLLERDNDYQELQQQIQYMQRWLKE